MGTRLQWAVALATGLAWGLTSAAPAVAASDPPPIHANAADADVVDFSTLLEPATTALPDPQPAGFSFLPATEGSENGPPNRPAAPAAWMISRPIELADSPMAPLPPAIVAGPIGIAFASFIAWRAKRRGGRI